MRAIGGRPGAHAALPERRRRVHRSSRSGCPTTRPTGSRPTIVSTPNGTTSRALVAADVAHIAWAVNLGCLGFHVWPNRAPTTRARRRAAHRPRSRSPASTSKTCASAAHDVRGVARRARHRGLAEDHGQPRHPRVRPARAASGTPIQVRPGAVAVARELARRHPDLITDAWWKEERGERVFIDFNQNAPHKTVFGAWSVRAATGRAGVDAVRVGRARRHRSRRAHHRRRCPSGSPTRGDPWATIDARPQSLRPLLDMYDRDIAVAGCRTRRGRPSTRRCRASRRASRRAGPRSPRPRSRPRNPRRRRHRRRRSGGRRRPPDLTTTGRRG